MRELLEEGYSQAGLRQGGSDLLAQPVDHNELPRHSLFSLRSQLRRVAQADTL